MGMCPTSMAKNDKTDKLRIDLESSDERYGMVNKMSRTATGLGLSTGHIQVAKPINSDTTFPLSEQWTPFYGFIMPSTFLYQQMATAKLIVSFSL